MDSQITKYMIEFIGTFALIFVVLLTKGNWLWVGAILALGLLIGGPFSSACCYNPVVAFISFLNGGLQGKHVIPYIIVEFIGGLGAYYTYKIMMSPARNSKGKR